MENLEQYGVAPLTEEQEAEVNGGSPLSDDVMYAAGVVVGVSWWLLRAGGSALGLRYMHL